MTLVSIVTRRIFSATECVLAVQGHPRSMIFVPIENAYTTSYLSPIVTMVISCNVSEIRLVGYKFPIFLTLSNSAPSLFRDKVNRHETRVIGLLVVKVA